MNHHDRAIELFKAGYNCAQAVFCTFCEEYGIDLQTGLRLSASFGGGLGRQREVCGTVSGMCMLAGLLYAPDDPADADAKAAHYARIQQLCGAFRAQTGSIICRELLGLSRPEGTPVPEPRTEAYYQKRPCAELCGIAAQVLDDYIRENGIPAER